MPRPPDPGYRFWSDGSTRTIRLDEMAEELRRELDQRRTRYPLMVQRGRLTELDAAAEVSMMAALVDEFMHALDVTRGGPAPRIPLNAYTWQQKIRCLRREIEIRRAYYPRAIAQRRTTYEDCQRHLSAIEAAHAWYWFHGLQYMEGDRAPGRAYRPGGVAANIRAEFARREAWAAEHHFDLTADGAYCAAIYQADWSGIPRPTKEQAA